MALSRSLLLLAVAALILLQPTVPKTTAEIPLHTLCEGSNYTANSAFHSNLNLLLTSLSLSASNSSFFSTHVEGSSDKAYGLFMCRGDLDPHDCNACVRAASGNITQLCALSKQATVFYDQCELRYSDFRFFSSANLFWKQILINDINETDPVTSTAAAKELMG